MLALPMTNNVSSFTPSWSRLRRLAYLDVYQSHYQSYELYNNYKKIVNSDAANNQLIVLLIAVALQ